MHWKTHPIKYKRKLDKISKIFKLIEWMPVECDWSHEPTAEVVVATTIFYE